MKSSAALDVGLSTEYFKCANSGGGWCVKTHTRTQAQTRGSQASAQSSETGYCINSVQNSNFLHNHNRGAHILEMIEKIDLSDN